MEYKVYTKKPDLMLTAIINIVLGLILFIWKGAVLGFAGTLFGVLLVVFGAALLGICFMMGLNGSASLAIGGLVLVVGIYFLLNPAVVVSIIPIIIGILILGNGIRSMAESISYKRRGEISWLLSMLISIGCIVFGVICVTDAFGIMERALQLVGIVLILNGLYNLFLGNRGSRKSYSKDDYIDVEFRD